MITLSQAKEQCNITGNEDDAELQTYVDATVGAVENAKGKVIEPRDITETLSPTAGDLLLSNVPLISVSSLVAQSGEVWDLSRLTLDTRAGLVSGGPSRGMSTITYRAGMLTVPPNYVLAALIIVQHLWKTQRGSGGSARLGGGDMATVPGMGFSVPNRALELLGSTLPGVA